MTGPRGRPAGEGIASGGGELVNPDHDPRRLGWLTRGLLWLIRGYQAGISPGLGTLCRFEPTCSRYAYAAVEQHGAIRGVWLAARRLGRCHPGTPGGYDPVPPRAR